MCAVITLQADIGQVYMKNGCSSCHGIYGEGIGASPRLQGQREDVLRKRLYDLKNGKTRSAFGTIMISFAQGLSNAQIDAMARWLSTLKKVEPEEKYELDNYFDNTGDGAS
jgi:cytochrome c553